MHIIIISKMPLQYKKNKKRQLYLLLWLTNQNFFERKNNIQF